MVVVCMCALILVTVVTPHSMKSREEKVFSKNVLWQPTWPPVFGVALDYPSLRSIYGRFPLPYLNRFTYFSCHLMLHHCQNRNFEDRHLTYHNFWVFKALMLLTLFFVHESGVFLSELRVVVSSL